MSTALAVSGSFGGLSVVPSFRYSDDINTKVKIPAGGSTTWSWETVLGVETAKEIRGVMVALSETQTDLWPMSGPNDGSLPYMRSLDGIKAYIVGDDAGDLDLAHIEAAKNSDGSYGVAKIKYFQWEKKGDRNIPPRAATTCIVAILREGEMSPLFVRLPKTSTPEVQKFAALLRNKKVQPYMAVVSLGLEVRKGASGPYSVVSPKYIEAAPVDGVPVFKEYFDAVSPLLRGGITKVTKANNDVNDVVPF
jgi:hypothetical protein